MRILFCQAPSAQYRGVLAGSCYRRCAKEAMNYLSWRCRSNLSDEMEYQGIPVHRFSFQNNFTPSVIDHVTEQPEYQAQACLAPDLVHINAVDPSNFSIWQPTRLRVFCWSRCTDNGRVRLTIVTPTCATPVGWLVALRVALIEGGNWCRKS
jgi:hypothetical protein